MASFKEAFAAGRAAFLKGGPKNFTWQGKSYSTDLASDTKKKPKAETAPPRRPPAKPVKAAKPPVTAPATSKRPKTRVDAVASAKPVPDKVAKDMLNMNIARATGDKLAADRKAEALSAERKTDATLRRAARQGGGRLDKMVKKVQSNQAALREGRPLGKSTGIGGRAAEALKKLLKK
jgi:hypothetical protein